MADKLTEAQKAEIKEAFSVYDKDGDGTISKEELGTVIKSLGRNPTDAEVQDMVNLLDADGSGKIEFEEFLAMFCRLMNDVDIEEDMLKAFKVYDKDGSGFISASELKEAMERLGEKRSDQEMAEIFKGTDLNADGKVSFEEFKKIINSGK